MDWIYIPDNLPDSLLNKITLGYLDKGNNQNVRHMQIQISERTHLSFLDECMAKLDQSLVLVGISQWLASCILHRCTRLLGAASLPV